MKSLKFLLAILGLNMLKNSEINIHTVPRWFPQGGDVVCSLPSKDFCLPARAVLRLHYHLPQNLRNAARLVTVDTI